MSNNIDLNNLLIHIGYHKTGTTFLQWNIFSKKDKGFCQPWLASSQIAIGHFVQTHPLKFDPSFVRSEFIKALESDPAKEKVPIISHETLSGLMGYPMEGRYLYGFDVAKRLYDTFPEAKIIIGVREQKSMIRSLYGQYIKQDGEWPLQEYLGTGSEKNNPIVKPVFRLDHLEYDLLVEQYAKLFGKDSILVLPLKLLRKNLIKYEQIIHDFANTGITVQYESSDENPNPAKGALTLELHRKLNSFIKRSPLYDGNYQNASYIWRKKQSLVKIADRIIPRSWHIGSEKRLREEIKERIKGYFAESNRKLNYLVEWDLAELGYEIF